MNILWFTWKDKKNPLAGGAEIVNEELAKRLAAHGHKVTLLVGGFPGAEKTEIIDGYTIIRVGNRYSVYIAAWWYYLTHARGKYDLVIDEINTIPFFTPFYVKEKKILFIHQLARQIWFYEMFFPLSIIGYVLEPIYLRILNDTAVVTVSKSTKDDLLKNAFKTGNIHMISEGIEIEPVADITMLRKYKTPTMLSLGSIRGMKQTIEQVKAFEEAKETIPHLRLIVAGGVGEKKYFSKFKQYIEKSRYSNDIVYLGRISKEKKKTLMQKSHVISVTSTKEGWGLIVTEANSQGTPAVVYNVDGLRDAVKHRITGYIVKRNTPHELARYIIKMIQDKKSYEMMRKNGYVWSNIFNFDNTYRQFSKIIKNV